ncbi:uncharacterized protein LOC143922884 isoform X2 [Arctopsyche grandis]|uniref:uncharacterized protein LOC143922884 isoform X2 n=1 Tax=Arctopsyche grandis TaxID=121162 RepID=UPI00406D86AC
MKEMVGGCCVCSDERGWPDNPLVYCDGNGCTVAVHQACYGIVTVPIGPWFCRKCESPDRQTKVRCELCPSRSGALKRSDSGGWAHVVCALYIPEVRFGNVTSMEPIILQLIPPERYNKTCYICHDLGKIHRSSVGACMQCNKSGCKQQFHVTCAQGLGLLCEEAGNYLDNVKYCGYCQHHYSKLDSHSSDSSPEKEGEASSSGGSALSPTASVVMTPLTLNNPTTSTSKNTSNKNGNVGRKGNIQHHALSNLVRGIPLKSTPPTPPNLPPGGISAAANLPSSTKSAQDKNPDKAGIKKWTGSPPQLQVEVINLNMPAPSTSNISNLTTTLRPMDMTSSESNENKGPKRFPKNSNNKFSSAATSKSTAVITNTSAPSVSAGSVISTPSGVQQPSQSPMGMDVKDKIVEGDAVFIGAAEIKQTKKRKAIAQPIPQDLSLHSNESNISSSSNTPRERPFSTGTPDSTNDDKVKKLKIEIPQLDDGPKVVITNQTPNYSGGLNIQMEPNLSAAPHLNNPVASTSHAVPISITTASSVSSQNQTFISDRSTISHVGASIQNAAHDTTSTSIVAHTTNTSLHIQSTSTKYLKESQMLSVDVHQTDIPSSLVVSVPLSQSAQGLNLTSQQNDTIIQSVSPQASSSSSWPLKIAYEPQANPIKNLKMSMDPGPQYPIPRRPRVEAVDMNIKSNIKNQQSGAILIDSIDKMASIATNGARNKKRITMPISMAGSSHSANAMNAVNVLSAPQPGSSKRLTQATPPPTTSVVYQDSPPRSPSSGRPKSAKYNVQRLNCAPHMLGNELNPESAVAARLSEHLSAELAAHSVFRAPSPLVAPPLINRATSNIVRTMSTTNASSIGLAAGGAQCLDQLLERQWEQGSQFLMEQAQHFDIASLLSCLHQLRTENVNLEEHVQLLTERRDHLLAVNARLAIPLCSAHNQSSESTKMSRESAGPSRQSMSAPSQKNEIMAERNQQVLMRDIQSKPS